MKVSESIINNLLIEVDSLTCRLRSIKLSFQTTSNERLKERLIYENKSIFERVTEDGEVPILLTSPSIRPFVRSIIERFRPSTVVLSQNEIHPKAKLKTLDQI